MVRIASNGWDVEGDRKLNPDLTVSGNVVALLS
jgi:hypothetical protein